MNDVHTTHGRQEAGSPPGMVKRCAVIALAVGSLISTVSNPVPEEPVKDAEVEVNLSLFCSRTLTPPARRTIPRVKDPLLLGWDTEYRPSDRSLLSIQFAAEVGGVRVGRVYDPPRPKISGNQLVGLVRRFLAEVGIQAPASAGGVRRVYLVGHYAAAELGGVENVFRDFTIVQVGKAHHATFRTEVDGERWELRVIDLAAYFKAALKKIGQFVGLPKLDEDRLHLEELKRDDPTRFEAYGLRDAEIALVAFTKFRKDILERWGIDPLLLRTLPAVATRILLHHFITTGPAPWKLETDVVPRRNKDGAWRNTRRTRITFAGDVEVRRLACLAFHGARVEAFVRGLVRTPVVERDVTSLYPSAALLQPLPTEKTKWLEIKTLKDVADLEGFAVAEFRFSDDQRYPSLPVKDERNRLCFPLRGRVACTFSELRAAQALGADLRILEAHGFEPGLAERDHDVAKFMRHFFEEKKRATKGSLEYETTKLILNSLVGKLAERGGGSDILGFEREALAAGMAPGAAAVVARSVYLRDALRRRDRLGSAWAPEWWALILGLTRALMGDIVARSRALVVSTDSIITTVDHTAEGPALDALRSVGSDLPEVCRGDAAFIARSRTYGILTKRSHVGPQNRFIGEPGKDWVLIRAARHGAVESESEFAETVLACLEAGRDVAPTRRPKRLLGAEEAVRTNRGLFEEVVSDRKTFFTWDAKRRLVDRDVNAFTSCSKTKPYRTIAQLDAAEHQRLVHRGQARQRRRRVSRQHLEAVFSLLRAGVGIREIARRTGIPKSTVADIRARMSRASSGDKDNHGIR